MPLQVVAPEVAEERAKHRRMFTWFGGIKSRISTPPLPSRSSSLRYFLAQSLLTASTVFQHRLPFSLPSFPASVGSPRLSTLQPLWLNPLIFFSQTWRPCGQSLTIFSEKYPPSDEMMRNRYDRKFRTLGHQTSKEKPPSSQRSAVSYRVSSCYLLDNYKAIESITEILLILVGKLLVVWVWFSREWKSHRSFWVSVSNEGKFTSRFQNSCH